MEVTNGGLLSIFGLSIGVGALPTVTAVPARVTEATVAGSGVAAVAPVGEVSG